MNGKTVCHPVCSGRHADQSVAMATSTRHQPADCRHFTGYHVCQHTASSSVL